MDQTTSAPSSETTDRNLNLLMEKKEEGERPERAKNN